MCQYCEVAALQKNHHPGVYKQKYEFHATLNFVRSLCIILPIQSGKIFILNLLNTYFVNTYYAPDLMLNAMNNTERTELKN